MKTLKYLSNVGAALRGKKTVVEVTAVRDIGYSAADLDELRRLYPVKLHEKGMTLEDHARIAAEQNVINYVEKIVKRRSSSVVTNQTPIT